MTKYISFHNHSIYSILDGLIKPKDIVAWAKANNMCAVGYTDHGEMSGCFALYKECLKEDIKPILGEEFYLTKDEVIDGKKVRDNHHIIILAKNRTGWDNMIKLHNISYGSDKFFYDARITLEDLLKHKEGLIVTSACIGGVVGRHWLNNELECSDNIIKVLATEFKDDFYLELQNHNSEDLSERQKQHDYNNYLIKKSKEYGIKCIVQNDAHYYLKEHWLAHQVLLCKNTHSKLKNPKFTFDSKEYYLKNEPEMLEMFNEYPLTFIEKCFNNTFEIANKIENFDITYKDYNYPKSEDVEQSFKTLTNLVKAGFTKRFGSNFNDDRYIERLKTELRAIKNIGFVDYFLMLDDLYKYAEKENIYVGCGRGSAGGSLVLYCLGVTHLDPIKYNLLFSRFIDESRISAPDVDCDFDDNDRPKIIKYLSDKYGKDYVCSISTYGELTAKSAFKAVASVLEIPFDKANNLTSIMDASLSLQDNYKEIDAFRCACQNDDSIKNAYEIALILEGGLDRRGIHACGQIISNKPLNEICPCVTVVDTKTKDRITASALEMKEIDGDLKMLKIDILGLRNLGIIKEADQLIKARHGISIDYKNLDYNDKLTYQNLCNGYTLGVFQFESELMRRLLKQVKPNCIQDLSAVTAGGRPGPLKSGIMEKFIKCKNGQEPINYIIPECESFMAETYGEMMYQEQLMQMCKVYSGFTDSEADGARKIVGKKLMSKMPELREKFIEGAKKLNRNIEQAEELFDAIEKFGEYGFNLSHAICYSALSYITAYYKTHYTIEFMTALLNSVTDDLDKLNLYLGECYRLGINIVAPDINISGKSFAINNKNEIVFSLSSVKGLGKSAITDIINARKYGDFKSLEDFISRTKKVDKGCIQSLLKVGAFNSIESQPKFWDMICDYISDAKNTKFYTECCDLKKSVYNLVGSKNAKKSEKYLEILELKRNLGTSKFDKLKKEEYNEKMEKIINIFIHNTEKYFLQFSKYNVQEKIENEQSLLGFNISTNPYKRWNDLQKFFVKNTAIPYVPLNNLLENGIEYINLPKVYTIGVLSDVKELKTKRGDRMAKLTLEYYGFKTTITVFSNQWENDLEFKIKKGNMFCVVGRLIEANKQYSTDDYEIKFNSIQQLNVLVNEDNKCIIDITDKDKEQIDQTVKLFTTQERTLNLPIEKVVIYKVKDKFLVTNGLCWINNPDKLAQRLT